MQTLPVLNDDEQPGIDAHFLMNDRPPLISPHLRSLELSGILFECTDLNQDGCPALEHLEITYQLLVVGSEEDYVPVT